MSVASWSMRAKARVKEASMAALSAVRRGGGGGEMRGRMYCCWRVGVSGLG